MDVVFVVAVFAAVFAVALGSIVWTNVQQGRRAKVKPPAHRGAFQSQRGRVYKHGSTSHNATPGSGT
ncbi:hypothetical protein J2790_003571 [Paenarthrobacter nicotinovorans]|uniref:hypothetical protein n=1 Tax=Micrococcaceae TaxID=1268 RepID=UPI000876D338|nr:MULTISPECIES: hypothetical protein [Micrococcaceae]MDR6438410.1 hypothetical protein [Paenarthrobacter nicotinovorans]BCW60939.1 hypothetical protein StoSoilB20_42860 [Arthrobacter sp. StoSoilB20]SCZ64252.1 hypothetical protein SAMN02799638_03832 [Arthrobacter sp. UNCCL28]